MFHLARWWRFFVVVRRRDMRTYGIKKLARVLTVLSSRCLALKSLTSFQEV